jgi:hypothetical protein
VQGEGLRHIVVRAEIQTPHPVVDRVARGQNQHRQRIAAGTQPPQHLEAVYAGQADVEYGEVELLAADSLKRLLAGGGSGDVVALVGQRAHQTRGE